MSDEIDLRKWALEWFLENYQTPPIDLKYLRRAAWPQVPAFQTIDEVLAAFAGDARERLRRSVEVALMIEQRMNERGMSEGEKDRAVGKFARIMDDVIAKSKQNTQ